MTNLSSRAVLQSARPQVKSSQCRLVKTNLSLCPPLTLYLTLIQTLVHALILTLNLSLMSSNQWRIHWGGGRWGRPPPYWPLQFSFPRRFLGIAHSFKVTRKLLKCLENAFPAINFSKCSGGEPPDPPPVGFATSVLARRRSTDFNPVLSEKHTRATWLRHCIPPPPPFKISGSATGSNWLSWGCVHCHPFVTQSLLCGCACL